MTAYAADTTAAAQYYLNLINGTLLFPVIVLLTAIAVVIFLYGCFEYIINASNPGAREKGRRNIIFGIIGLLIMTSAYAILIIAAGTFGIDAEDPYESSFGFIEPAIEIESPVTEVPPVANPLPEPQTIEGGRVLCSNREACPDFSGEMKGTGAVGSVYVAEIGSDVSSLGSGRVATVFGDNMVVVIHDDGTEAEYRGVSLAPGVVEGARVEKGQRIGEVGTSMKDYASYTLAGNEAAVVVDLVNADFRSIDQDRYVRTGEVSIVDSSVFDAEP